MLQLKIVSPERIEFEGDVKRVVVPGTAGMFEILSNHAPIISTLDKGVVEYTKTDGTNTSLDITKLWTSTCKQGYLSFRA